MQLTEHTVLVTGASSGIGRETAVVLSQLGARVILVARDKDRLQSTFELLEGQDHYIEPFDLNNVDDIPRWLKGVASVTGQISGLVHSAGLQVTVPARLLSNSDFERVMRLNVYAAASLTKAVRLKSVRGSTVSVVLLSSVMGLVGAKGVSAYSASKGAVGALTRSLALEFAQEAIRVNCVAPGHVHTEMAEKLQQSVGQEQFNAIELLHPLGIGTARDVAYAIAFLLSDMSRWITGTTLVVDGGYTAQ